MENLIAASDELGSFLSANPMRDNHTPLADVAFKYGEESRLEEGTPDDPGIEEYIRQMTGMTNGMYEGLPYLGPKIDIKEADPEYMKPQKKIQTHVKQFNLDDPQQLADYNTVCHRIATNQAVLGFEERTYDAAIQSWRVLMRWYDQFYVAPEGENYGQPRR
jgi:hypothetical protein